MTSTQSKLLGEGVYAKVYRHKNHALKITELKSQEDLTSVVREYHVLQMGLPHCVPVHNFYYKWDCMHVELSLADMALTKVIKKGLSHDKILKYGTQMLLALSAMHKNQIMHRDLKPDNVLIKDDKIWLCDFGLSRQYANDYGVATGYMVTRWYRAPEIWLKQSYTEKVDMWSLGCILHQMVHKKVPGKTLPEIRNCVAHLPNETKIDKLIVGLLKEDANQRWSASKALKFLQKKCLYKVETKEMISDVPFTDKRQELFIEFYSRFPEEYRCLSHGLMLFDQTACSMENMYSAMAVSCMLFKTRPSKMLKYILKSRKLPLKFIGKFINDVLNSTQKISQWENFEGSFEEYLKLNGIRTVKKRKLMYGM